MPRASQAAWAVALAASAVAWAPSAAAAGLREAAERVAQAWRDQGASVVLQDTRFVNDDETVPLRLPSLPDGACTTIVIVGPRSLGFRATFGKTDDDADRVESEAGVLSIGRCGQPLAGRLLVTAESGRGALETVVAVSARPLQPVRELLPERGSGPAPAPAEPGALEPLPPPEQRADLAETRARRDGARIEARQGWLAGADGAGAGETVLQPGCHALGLFAPDPRASSPNHSGKLDLDAEMRDEAGDHVLARDRSDAPDARLAVCLGEATPVEVGFVGAPPGAQVLVAHVAWPMPEHLSSAWGPEAIARMAHVLLTRHVGSLLREPVLLAQGGSGATTLPISIEPGACYVALAAVTQGSARSIALDVRVASRDSFDDRGINENGAVAAFCAGDRDRGALDIEVHGTPLLGWGLAIYRMVDGIWELPR